MCRRERNREREKRKEERCVLQLEVRRRRK